MAWRDMVCKQEVQKRTNEIGWAVKTERMEVIVREDKTPSLAYLKVTQTTIPKAEQDNINRKCFEDTTT